MGNKSKATTGWGRRKKTTPNQSKWQKILDTKPRHPAKKSAAAVPAVKSPEFLHQIHRNLEEAKGGA